MHCFGLCYRRAAPTIPRFHRNIERVRGFEPSTLHQSRKQEQKCTGGSISKMITSCVLLVQDASSNSITTLHDKLANEIPKVLGRWSFDLKIFKANSQTMHSSDSGFLYDVILDYQPTKAITIVNKTAIMTTVDTPKDLLESGCSNGSPDSFGQIIQGKLQSLWVHRQTLKGENGNGYELRGGEFVVRTVNVFLHGNFKNFLVIIEHHTKSNTPKTSQLSRKKIERLIQELELPKGKLCHGGLEGSDEYLAVVGSQLIEALQG